eukprot:4667636-Amphidinium_carterae.1
MNATANTEARGQIASEPKSDEPDLNQLLSLMIMPCKTLVNLSRMTKCERVVKEMKPPESKAMLRYDVVW